MKSFGLLSIALVAAFTLNAQNEKKSEIQIKIIKDGETIKDTIYMVEDGKAAERASKILDMTLGEPKERGEHKVMTFISEDGEMHEFHSGDADVMKIHKMHPGNTEMVKEKEVRMKMIQENGDDTQVFVTTEESEDGETKVIVKKFKMGEDGDIHKIMSAEGMNEEEHEMLMKMIHESDDNTRVFVTKEEGENGETKVIVKKIKISEDGEESTLNEEENVFIMKAGEEGELKHFHHKGEEPVWIEKDGAKVLIIDSKDGSKKKIMVVTDSEPNYEFKTEKGETIIIHTKKDGKNEKEVNVEVVVKDENDSLKTNKKKDKKKKK